VAQDARLLGEDLAGLGQFYGARGALEQARAQHLFQPRQRARDGRLRQVHLQRRAPKAQRIGQRQKDIDLAGRPIDLHGRSVYRKMRLYRSMTAA